MKSKMHWVACIILLMVMHTVCRAQRLEATTGGTATSSGVSMTWSIGEAIVARITGSITQQVSIGFQQNHNATVTGIEEYDFLGVNLFPNPARGYIVLELQNGYDQDVELTVFNLSGSRLIQKKITAFTRHIELDISGLTSGPYEIIIVSPNAKLAGRHFIKL